MKNGWMVRAGNGGMFVEEFREQNAIAIGWNEIGDLNQFTDKAALRIAYEQAYPNDKPGKIPNAIAMMQKFRDEIQKGDLVISYDSERREYLLEEDKGEYQYLSEGKQIGDFANARWVNWLGAVSRDHLSISSKNSLGSVLTLFSLSEDVIAELLAALEGKSEPVVKADEIVTNLTDLKDEAQNKSHELVKDKIQSLSPDDMEQLAAALLRGMGYQTRVSPRGPDRGLDVLASPDGLGLQQPRIKAEVKHRGGSIGAPELRCFIGSLRDGDNGLYVSTGGFTREARYEADRATLPITLIDIDYLADLIVTHYENFNMEGRTLFPLVKVYWPAE